jgi:hypothetical protein
VLQPKLGQCCKFQELQESGLRGIHLWRSGGQPEQLSDEPNLTQNIISPQPPSLPVWSEYWNGLN